MTYTRVSDLTIPELDVYLQGREPLLEHYFEPERGVFIAESVKVTERALDAGYEPMSFLVEEDQLASVKTMLSRFGSLDKTVYITEKQTLQSIIGYHMTRGVLCAMRRPILPPVEEVIRGTTRLAIMENVVNPTNVGAIFRSAAALNMDAVLLTKGCADPLQRRACRVSMGTVFQIPWTYLDADWPEGGMRRLQEQGFKTAALALTDKSISMSDPCLTEEAKIAMILGTEGEGLMQSTIDASDYTVKIPMGHGVDSLNVAAASAVAFWEITRCR